MQNLDLSQNQELTYNNTAHDLQIVNNNDLFDKNEGRNSIIGKIIHRVLLKLQDFAIIRNLAQKMLCHNPQSYHYIDSESYINFGDEDVRSIEQIHTKAQHIKLHLNDIAIPVSITDTIDADKSNNLSNFLEQNLFESLLRIDETNYLYGNGKNTPLGLFEEEEITTIQIQHNDNKELIMQNLTEAMNILPSTYHMGATWIMGMTLYTHITTRCKDFIEIKPNSTLKYLYGCQIIMNPYLKNHDGILINLNKSYCIVDYVQTAFTTKFSTAKIIHFLHFSRHTGGKPLNKNYVILNLTKPNILKPTE